MNALDASALSAADIALMAADGTARQNDSHNPKEERRNLEIRHAALIPKLIGEAVVPRHMRLTQFADVHDNIGQRAVGSWRRIAERLTDHKVGEKNGPCIATGIFNGYRGVGSLISQQMLALDIEGAENGATGECTKPPSIADVAATMRRLGLAGTVASTHSSKLGDLRYRVFVALDLTFVPGWDEDRQDGLIVGKLLADVLAFDLGLRSVLDPSKRGGDSLFFLPRHPEVANDFEAIEVEGTPYPLGRALAHTKLMWIDDRMHVSAVARAQARKARLRALDPTTERTRAKIDAFNAEHRLADVLNQYGYKQRGKWKSPYQHADSAGATRIHRDADGRERWTSCSESDAAAGIGHKPALLGAVTCCGSAFDLFSHFEHAGNFKRALNSLPTPRQSASATSAPTSQGASS